MFTIQTSFKPLLLKGGGGEIEVTVNSKEENSCPNYVREFGLWREMIGYLSKKQVE
jgi:hypothetical protein